MHYIHIFISCAVMSSASTAHYTPFCLSTSSSPIELYNISIMYNNNKEKKLKNI